MEYHQPVLLDEVLTVLEPGKGKVYVDGTLGNGGHTIEILKLGAKVVGIDRDPTNLKLARERIEAEGLSDNFTGVAGNFIDTKKILTGLSIDKVDGILLDLGLSRNQQVSSGRGFSFNDKESLDMRLDPEIQKENAELLINVADEEELFTIFSKNAQEKLARPLAQKIIRERQKEPIKTGERLARIIREFYGKRGVRSKVDPSTKIFMALRIAVNSEFANLKKILLQMQDLVLAGGVVGVISFHSGEDRLVKRLLPGNKRVLPSKAEINRNPLSRSAILRWVRIT